MVPTDHPTGCCCSHCAAASRIDFPDSSETARNLHGGKFGDSFTQGTPGGVVTYAILDLADRSTGRFVGQPVTDDMTETQRQKTREAFFEVAEFADIDFLEVDDPSEAQIHISIGSPAPFVGFATWDQIRQIAGVKLQIADVRDDTYFKQIVLHELGHGVGLTHGGGEDAVMNAFVPASGGLKAGDYGALFRAYGQVTQAEETGRGFNPSEYLSTNPDLIDAGIDTPEEAINHYQAAGAGEGRAIAFDEALYLEANPDLVDAGVTVETAARHYQAFGEAEGRLTDVRTYLALNPDLQALSFTRVEAAIHFQEIGRNEGRLTEFDASLYRLANADLSMLSDDQALSHYLAFGRSENRPFFKVEDYLADRPDLIASGADILSLLGESLTA